MLADIDFRAPAASTPPAPPPPTSSDTLSRLYAKVKVHAPRLFGALSDAALAKSAGDSVLYGYLTPMFALQAVLVCYLVWLPFGYVCSLLAYLFSTPGVLVLLVFLGVNLGVFVARMMVFPGSVSFFSLSMEREYAGRLRGGIKDSVDGIEAALLRAAACTRGGGALERRELLSALSALRLPRPSATQGGGEEEEVDLLSAPSSRPPRRTPLLPASPACPVLELRAFHGALSAHRRAALVGGAARAHLHRGIPWGSVLVGESWSQHAAALHHYSEASLKLVSCVGEALAAAAATLPHEADLLSDPMPMDGSSPYPRPTLTLHERSLLGVQGAENLLLSPAPLTPPPGGPPSTAPTTGGGGIEPMSLTLTMAAALAAVRRLKLLLPWLEVVPHWGVGGDLALQDVAELSLRDHEGVWVGDEALEEQGGGLGGRQGGEAPPYPQTSKEHSP